MHVSEIRPTIVFIFNTYRKGLSALLSHSTATNASQFTTQACFFQAVLPTSTYSKGIGLMMLTTQLPSDLILF